MLRTRFISALLLLCAALGSAFVLRAAQQDPTANFAAQPSTSERLKKPGWWPTKHSARAEAYAGTTSCASCHSEIAASQKMAEMARTAQLASASPILESKPTHEFKVEQYAYKVTSNPPAVTVSDGKQSIRAPLAWAIGSGAIGQVYFAPHNDITYETQFTYYPDIHAFDTTTAHARVPSGLDAALGKQLSNSDVRKCFSCHSTGMTAAEPFDPHRVALGIQCEACHGPGIDHAQAMKRNDENGRDLIFNTKQLSPADQVDFCGACHKSAVDVASDGLSGVPTVRFPAYRLEMSRCWGTSGDRRIVCAACHNPHKPLVHELASYDKNCLACHQNRSATAKPSVSATSTDAWVPHSERVLFARTVGSNTVSPEPPAQNQSTDKSNLPGKACPVATSNCASCHMPKYELPDAHHRFTDHRIRSAREGDPYPD
ncbi:MAG TPA: multiheme c-type cytochrome [Terriglobales bacterium]